MDQLWQFLQSVHFENPSFIWWRSPLSFGCLLLFFAVMFTGATWWLWYRGRVQAIKSYGTESLVTRWTQLPTMLSAGFTLAALVLFLVLGVTAATMPFQNLGTVNVPAGSVRVIAVFDESRSMGAENRDDPPLYGGRSCTMVEGPCGRRIEIARLIFQHQVMPVIEGNQIGLVVYSGAAVTKSFLTDDYQAISEMLERGWIDVGTSIGEGTFLHDGINTAVKVLQRDPAGPGETNVIVLFTDGENHSKPEDLKKALDAAKEAGALLIVVGVGSTEPAYIPIYDSKGKPVYANGQRYYHTMKDGTVAETARDDAFLEQLVAMAGGRYVIADPGKALDIDWPTSLAGSRAEIAKKYLYGPLVASMMGILVLIWLLGPLTVILTRYLTARAAGRGLQGRR